MPSLYTRMVTVRLSIFYGVFFSMFGVFVPFWPVWLKGKGLDPSEIGIVFAITIAGKTLIVPTVAWLAERLNERRRLIVSLSLGAAIFFGLFAFTDGFWQIFLVSALFAVCWTGLMPMTDNLTLLTARERELDYGRIRLWGSITFIATAMLAGQLLSDGKSDWMIFPLVWVAVSLSFLASLLLPDTKPALSTIPKISAWRLMRVKPVALFLVAVSLAQSSHAVYYAFSTIHWRDAGIGDHVIGWLWAEGVIAEVILFALGTRISRKVGPAGLLVLSGIAATIRWSVIGLSTDLAVLATVQALHAFTFGAAHLAAMNFITKAIPPSSSASGQALYSSFAYGLGTGLATLAAGPLYESFHAHAFHAMAGMGVLCALSAVWLAGIWKGGRIDEPGEKP